MADSGMSDFLCAELLIIIERWNGMGYPAKAYDNL